MLHFTLKDIAPEKVNDTAAFLKEMNGLAFLATNAKAPFLDTGKVVENNGKLQLSLKEEDYKVIYEGVDSVNDLEKGVFILTENQKTCMEVHFSKNEMQPIDMRVVLNCSGEGMVKTEFESVFKRDFSAESHLLMRKSLEEIQQENAEKKLKAINEEKSVDAELENDLVDVEQQASKKVTAVSDEADVVKEELKKLSEKVLKSIDEVNLLILELNDFCYDVTRGKTSDLTKVPLKYNVLSSGAEIEHFNATSNNYKITFRKGKLSEVTEVSFFLEKEEELVFSLYLSNEGRGEITVNKKQAYLSDRLKKHMF